MVSSVGIFGSLVFSIEADSPPFGVDLEDAESLALLRGAVPEGSVPSCRLDAMCVDQFLIFNL